MIAAKNSDLLKLDFGRKIAQLAYGGKWADAYRLRGDGMSNGQDPLAGQDDLTRTICERLTY